MKLKMLGCVSIAQLTSAIQKFFSGISYEINYGKNNLDLSCVKPLQAELQMHRSQPVGGVRGRNLVQ